MTLAENPPRNCVAYVSFVSRSVMLGPPRFRAEAPTRIAGVTFMIAPTSNPTPPPLKSSRLWRTSFELTPRANRGVTARDIVRM